MSVCVYEPYVCSDCRSNMKITIIITILFLCPLHMHRISEENDDDNTTATTLTHTHTHNSIPTNCVSYHSTLHNLYLCIPIAWTNHTQFHSIKLVAWEVTSTDTNIPYRTIYTTVVYSKYEKSRDDDEEEKRKWENCIHHLRTLLYDVHVCICLCVLR